MTAIKSAGKNLRLFYCIGFILALSNALIAYVNSSYLGEFWGAANVGLVFIAAYAVSLVVVNFFPDVINYLKIYLASLAALCLMFLGLLGLGVAAGPWAALVFFIFYVVCLNLIWISLDVYVEYFSVDSRTGRIRGMYWTLVNLAWFLAPVTSGLILKRYNYPVLFYAADVLLFIALMFFTFGFRRLKPDHFSENYFFRNLARVWQTGSLRRIFIIDFLLQLFYCLMIIYTPLYLHAVIGFNWEQIGLIFAAMLFNFVYMTYPAGWLADTKFGEKGMIIAGLFIMGLATLAFALIHGRNFWLFFAALFFTRVGASLVDILKDSYFFKHVNSHDLPIINMFRNSVPLAYIIGPLLAMIILRFADYRLLFVSLALLVLAGGGYALGLKNTGRS